MAALWRKKIRICLEPARVLRGRLVWVWRALGARSRDPFVTNTNQSRAPARHTLGTRLSSSSSSSSGLVIIRRREVKRRPAAALWRPLISRVRLERGLSRPTNENENENEREGERKQLFQHALQTGPLLRKSCQRAAAKTAQAGRTFRQCLYPNVRRPIERRNFKSQVPPLSRRLLNSSSLSLSLAFPLNTSKWPPNASRLLLLSRPAATGASNNNSNNNGAA